MSKKARTNNLESWAEMDRAQIEKAIQSRFLVLNKLEGMLRQKIEEEVNQLRTEIQTKLDTLKKDMQEEMRQLQRTVQAAAPPAVPLAAQTATPASLYAVQRQR